MKKYYCDGCDKQVSYQSDLGELQFHWHGTRIEYLGEYCEECLGKIKRKVKQLRCRMT